MKIAESILGVLLFICLVLACGTTFGQSDTASTHAQVISPNNTNFLNPDHVRSVSPTDPWANGTNSAPHAPAPTVFVPPNPLPARDHWTWDVQNREFTNVVITKVEADLVTIKSDSGANEIDISLLPADIQKQLNYDPDLAAKAAADRDAAASKPAPPPSP